jgi:hypothetical protein
MANTTVNIDIQVQSKSINKLEEELEAVNKQLKATAQNDPKFGEYAKEAQELTRQLDAANEAAEGFTDDKKFLAADGAIKVLGGSLAGVVGVLGTLGVESEAFGEFEKKAASAIAVAIGLKDISEGFRQISQSSVLASAKAKLFGITTKQALIATGVGIFVVALGSIVAYWDDITKAVTKFGEKVPFVGKAIETIKNAFDAIVESVRPVLEFLGILPDEIERANTAAIEANTAVIESGERELALLQAQQASAEEIFKKKEQMLQAELDNLKRNEADKEEIYKKETELLALQAAEETRIANEQEAKRQERIAKREAEREKEEQSEKDRLQALADIQEEFNTKQEDYEDQTEQQKLERQRERQLAELEQLQASEEQKAQVIAYYDQLIRDTQAEAKLAEDEKLAEEAEKKKEERAADLQAEADLEQKKLEIKKQSLQTLSELFGQETALGKAALIAKQAILVKELLAETKGLTFKAKNAATEATIDGAKAGSAIAAGSAETAKVGFPQNIPLLIGYAAQAVGIISAVKGAVSKTKSIAGVGGPSLSGLAAPQVSAVSAPAPQNVQTVAPQVVTTTPTVQAYVLSGNVTSAQEADAKLSTRRQLG